jgi:hypothetical protein
VTASAGKPSVFSAKVTASAKFARHVQWVRSAQRYVEFIKSANSEYESFRGFHKERKEIMKKICKEVCAPLSCVQCERACSVFLLAMH